MYTLFHLKLFTVQNQCKQLRDNMYYITKDNEVYYKSTVITSK